MASESLLLKTDGYIPQALRSQSQPPKDASVVWRVGGLVVILLVGLSLRFYSLSARSLWFDEAFSWRLVEFPLPEMIQRVGQDNHPPLYFLLLKAWASVFGVSEWSLRGLSVLLAGATIVGVYLFSWEAFGQPDQTAEQTARRHRLALFAAAAVALSVFQIRWSWEVRMYTLGTALAAFCSWALFRALHAPASALRPWLLFGLLDLLFLYTHYYALFSIAAQLLFLAGLLLIEARGNPRSVFRDPRLWHGLVAGCLLVIGWLPWLPTFLAQREQVRTAFWSRPVRSWDVADACGRMLLCPENGRIAISDGLVASGVCVLIVLTVLWRGRAGAWYIFVATITPLALSVLLSLAGTQVFHCRYLVFANLFLLAALGVVIGRIPFAVERTLLAGGIVAICLGSYGDFWWTLNVADKPGARAAAAWVDSQRRAGEPVVVSSPLFFLSLLYHTADRRDWYVFDHGHGLVHYEGAAVITAEEIVTATQLHSLQAQRIWVVDMEGGGWGRRFVPVPREWIRRREQRFPEVYDVQGEVVVVEYEVSPDSRDSEAESLKP
jgi:mannosyltransferase